MNIKDIKVGDIVPPDKNGDGEGGVVVKIEGTCIYVDTDGDGVDDEIWFPDEIDSVTTPGPDLGPLRLNFIDALAVAFHAGCVALPGSIVTDSLRDLAGASKDLAEALDI